jgi:hypothetical protein
MKCRPLTPEEQRQAVVDRTAFGDVDGFNHHVCWKPGCGTTLTAIQEDGRWGCPWHWALVQGELFA